MSTRGTMDCPAPDGGHENVGSIYQADGITLHHGDSLQLLPQLDGPYDAPVTDPPYSSGGRTAAERRRPPSDKYVQGGSHNVDFAGEMMDARSWTHWCARWLELARQQVKPGGYALVFTDCRQLPALTDAI